MEVIQCFPQFFLADQGNKVAHPVTLEEVKKVLDAFTIDKKSLPLWMDQIIS